VTIDDAIAMLKRLGKGAFMAKTDIKSAYRVIPLHKSEHELFGICWKNEYFYDKCLCFGLRSAPFIFSTFSDLLEWILKNNYHIGEIIHILDDFLLATVGPNDQQCRQNLQTLLQVFHNLGVPIAEEKTEGPAQVMVFMGIELDSVAQEARLPSDKLQRLKSSFAEWGFRTRCTLRELQSLIGVLNWVCAIIPAGRAFLQRMIALTRGVKLPRHHIRLTAGFKKDLTVWETFVKNWNGKSFFLKEDWESRDSVEIYTDASGTEGFGGFWKGQWFNGQWPEQYKLTSGKAGLSIEWQELYPIRVACVIWGTHFQNKRVTVWCDNESVVAIINTMKSKVPEIMDLIRPIVAQSLEQNFVLKAVHLSSEENSIADALSRFQMDKFRQLAPKAAPVSCSIPASLMLT